METTKYYAEDGGYIEAINLKEPVRLDDFHYTTPHNIMKEMLDATDDDLIAMMHPDRSLQKKLFDAIGQEMILTSEGEDSGTIKFHFNEPVEGPLVEVNRQLRFNGGSLIPTGRNARDVRISKETSSGYKVIPNTNTTFRIAGIYEANGTNGSATSYTMLLLRDYTGAVGIARVQYLDYQKTPHITLRSVLSLSEYEVLSSDFWNGIGNDEPIIDEGEGIVDINNRFAPRIGMNGLGVYPITKEDLQDFVKDLWTETFVEKILKSVNGDVMNNIVSLRWFYGIGGSIPRSEYPAYIRLGNQSMNGSLGTQTVTSRPALSELMTYSLGSITIPRKYNNFLDLSPFTRLQLFIPYVGFVTLDMTEFAGRRLRLDYNINIVSGAAIAYVYVQENNGSWRIAYEQATTLGVEIPLSINSRESIATRMATALSGAAMTAAGGAVGSMFGPVGSIGGAMAGHGISQEVLGSTAQTVSNGISGLSSTASIGASSRNGGGIDNETGSLGDFQPSVLITRPKAVPPSDYNMMVGLPDNNSGTVGSFNGYIKAGAIKQSAGIGIPRQAMDEIDQMLRAGVYTQ